MADKLSDRLRGMAVQQSGSLSDRLQQRAQAQRQPELTEFGEPVVPEIGGALAPAPVPATQPITEPTRGPLGRVKESLGRIGEAVAEPFEGVSIIPSGQALLEVAQGMAASMDVGLLPRSTRGERIMRGGDRVMSGLKMGLKAIGATFEAGVEAFGQTLQELGMSRTGARRAQRDFVALLDVSGIASVSAPSATLRQIGRDTRRAAVGSEKAELEIARRAKLREERLAERAENTAELEARKAARENAPEGMHPDQVRVLEDTAAARARVAVRNTKDDIEADAAQTDALLQTPEDLLMEVPVFTREVLAQPAIRKAIATAEDSIRTRGLLTGESTPERVTQIVIDQLNSGGITATDLAADLTKAGVSQQDFLVMLGATSSEAGRTLRQFRGFRDFLRETALRGDEAAQSMLRNLADIAKRRADDAARGITPTEAAEPYWRQGSRLFRKLLVSLPATAARNLIESFGTRIALQTANRAIDSTLRRIFRPSDPLIDPINPFDEWYRAVFPEGRRMTTKELETLFSAFPEARNKLWSTLEADISMVKARESGRFIDHVEAGVDNVLLWFNRAQSKLVRGPIFAAQLDRNLRTLGSSLEDVVDFGKIPAGFEGAMKDAMDLALYTDFTLTPKTGPLAEVFKGYSKILDNIPGAAIFEPFPRFIYNALKLVIEQTPTAGLRLLRPKSRAAIADGDYSEVAREITGTAMLATAIAVRKGQVPGIDPGANWDEVRTRDGNTVSLSPFVLMNAPLFMADILIRMEEGRMPNSFEAFRDLREGFIGRGPQVRLGNAVTQEAFDALSGIDSSASYDRFLEFSSEQVSAGVLRPFQLLRDFMSEWDETWAVHRETRGQGIYAPAAEIFAPSILPPRYLPTRSDPASIPKVPLPFTFGQGPRVSGNIARHVTGSLYRERRNAIEHELAFQGFKPRDLVARTGDPFLDNLVARNQGPVVEMLGELLVQSPAYIAMPNSVKQEVLRQFIIATREVAMDAAKEQAPQAFALRKLERMPGIQREAVFTIIDNILADRVEGLDFERTSRQILDSLRSQRRKEEERILINPEGAARQQGGTNEQQ